MKELRHRAARQMKSGVRAFLEINSLASAAHHTAFITDSFKGWCMMRDLDQIMTRHTRSMPC